jgi:ribosomal protein S18 acetylase RimI-like enzyme
MITEKANKTNRLQIQVLMDELNEYRKKIFSEETKDFHERINPYKPLEEEDFDDSIFFITKDESNKVVGFIQGTIHERKNHKLGKLGYIDELYVQESTRGKGVAKNLFTELEFEFKNQGCDHITTHTDIENSLSQQFYLQAGMNKTTVELWKEL